MSELQTNTKVSTSLYEIEDNLLALLETEGAVTEAQDEAFRVELAKAMKTAVDKREAAGRFILQMEANAAFAKSEAKRIAERAKIYENVAERVRAYVLAIIEGMELDKNNKLPKLEGHTIQMSARALPMKVEVIDGASVPSVFKYANVRMSAADWAIVLECLEVYEKSSNEILKRLFAALEWEIDNSAIKAAVKRDEVVPGVEKLIGGYTLVVK